MSCIKITIKGGEYNIMIHCMSWLDIEGEHKFYRKDYNYLKLLAYYKAFYFPDVKLDGILVTREF